MAKKYRIETFGCQMNVHDSERMAGLLDRAGYEAAQGDSDADVIVINTCSVREHAEEKLYTRLGELRGLEPHDGQRPLVVVAGCVAQQEGGALLKRKNGNLIDVIIGTHRLKMLPMLLEQAADAVRAEVEIGASDDASFPLGVTHRTDPVRAYVTIIEGCNDHCTFCVVPYTRGHERMRAKSDILADVREATASGRKEIHLLGQIVNHYQAPDDPRCDFAGLLADVHEVPGVERIRFASPHPRHTSARVIEVVRDLPKVCKHLHLPAQSGSTRILGAMRRRYSRDEYLDLVGRIRAAIPGVTLTTDMIVGFPGETAEDFDQTLSLTESVRYLSMFSFKYSSRPNTLASKRLTDDVSDVEKTSRIMALQALQRDIQSRLHEEAIGSTVDVLIDTTTRRLAGEVSGRSAGNMVVNCTLPADTPPCEHDAWLGRTVAVRIERAGPHNVRGTLATTPGDAPC